PSPHRNVKKTISLRSIRRNCAEEAEQPLELLGAGKPCGRCRVERGHPTTLPLLVEPGAELWRDDRGVVGEQAGAARANNGRRYTIEQAEPEDRSPRREILEQLRR